MTSLDPTAIELEVDPRVKRMRGVAVHGDTPFDVPYVSEITENFWVGGCADGLHLPELIDHVISLYPWEQYEVNRELKSALFVRMYDADGEPDGNQIHAIAEWVNRCREDGPTLLHCQAGLNRSNLVAATALVLGGAMRSHRIDCDLGEDCSCEVGEGMTPADAIALLREKRSPAVLCNPSFERWVMGLR